MAGKHSTFFNAMSYHVNLRELSEVRTRELRTIVTGLRKAFHFILGASIFNLHQDYLF